MAKTRHEIFTIIGDVRMIKDKDGSQSKRFIPKSPEHLKVLISRLPVGKTLACTFFEDKSTRSRAQLAYHWVLMGYLSAHTGFTEQEMHEAVMILKFGTKPIKLGSKTVNVRRSISDDAKIPKFDAVELISYDLELCAEMEIRVPTAEELGYVTTSKLGSFKKNNDKGKKV